MSTSTLQALSVWLTHTQLSGKINGAMWVIPTIQTLHILSISVAISSVFLLNLRLIGVFAKTQSTTAVANRVLPWVWGSLAALAVSGSLLIVAEPERSLLNAVFGVKLLMLTAAVLTLGIQQRGLRRKPGLWESTPGVLAARRVLAVASLFLWTSVVFAGRLVAYLSFA